MANLLDESGLRYFWGKLKTLLAGKAPSSHTHDDRYYTESEVDTLLSGYYKNPVYKSFSMDYTGSINTNLTKSFTLPNMSVNDVITYTISGSTRYYSNYARELHVSLVLPSSGTYEITSNTIAASQFALVGATLTPSRKTGNLSGGLDAYKLDLTNVDRDALPDYIGATFSGTLSVRRVS